MSSPTLNFAFPHTWTAEILAARPAILPARNFAFPAQVEEVERGALEVLVTPDEHIPPFLATCAVGFQDPIVPSGIWSAPNPRELCAVSGGYAYLIDTTEPKRFTMLPYRPVLQIHPAIEAGLLLFVGHRAIIAWGHKGEAWQSPMLSDEGITISSVEGMRLHGTGWHILTDAETPFTLDLRSGQLE